MQLSDFNPLTLKNTLGIYPTIIMETLGAGLLIYAPFSENPKAAVVGGLCGLGAGLLHTYRMNSLRRQPDRYE